MSYLSNNSESSIYTIHNWKNGAFFDLGLVKICCCKWIQINKYYVYTISHLDFTFLSLPYLLRSLVLLGKCIMDFAVSEHTWILVRADVPSTLLVK